jgi:hypothetical protein
MGFQLLGVPRLSSGFFNNSEIEDKIVILFVNSGINIYCKNIGMILLV